MITPDNLAEEQLQQELREMFLVDTQQQLETYFDLTQQLSPQSWIADIQHIYRAIHTIKGGAVTVEANEMLHAAMVLEDLLSDLRYLEISPPLADGQLSQLLLEAGELLASCLEISETGNAAIDRVQLTIQRLTTLHAQVKERYLPDWDEMKQVHQEFAEQGFDLVVLELEMSLNQLPPSGTVAAHTIAIGDSMLQQLRQIGQDLNLAEGWTTLLQSGQALIDSGDCQQWRASLPEYLVLLKQCAKNSGEIPPAAGDESAPMATSSNELTTWNQEDELTADDESLWGSIDHNLDQLWSWENPDIDDNIDLISLDLDLETVGSADELVMPEDHAADDLASMLDDFLGDADLGTDDIELADLHALMTELTGSESAAVKTLAPVAKSESAPTADKITDTRRNIQIPVPLDRLDRSAQQVVDTLLTTRGVTSQSQKLRSQLAQLTTLTAESAQFTTKLRQLQDDYALLRNLSDEQESANNLTLERYRQGYSTINRLLENILRMSELGQEIETSTHQTFDSLAHLDRQILGLKDGIEVNRLVPFRNLTMRARAILRDLTNRYGKPVKLIVANEQIELDAGVVQQLEPALLHLLRNAYDHGIEAVAERLAAGKAAQGQITLALQRRGNVYRLTIQDDGQGINAATIHAQAQARGFAQTITSTSTALLAVLCQPGFSSRSAVSEVSGRGVGMDVVANQIAAIGGKLQLDTELRIGTTFTIEVPAPQLLVSCILLRAGERTIALPTEEILETILLSTTDVQLDPEQGRWQISTARGMSWGWSLAAYWPQFSNSLPATAIGLRCRRHGQPDVWLIADDLLEQAELLINPLPSPLVPPPGMLGVSLQPDGNLVSVLDPAALTTVLPARSATPVASPAVVPVNVTTILIVDDAALMRRRLAGSLTSAGFAVHTCGDGLEALQWLQTNQLPALMITDVEMPNMDGLTLIDRCRKTGIPIPILVLSSRLSEDWGKEAQRVGANKFLNKGFTTDELLSAIEQLLAKIPTPV
jgi:chemotaxis protein histidine kinase CheA/ActR/RegA family two-component response regulator